jgi:hypothetical protein
MDKPNLDHNKITQADRACVNCKHLVRSWRPRGLTDWLITKIFDREWRAGNHYLCGASDSTTRLNPVTGQVRVLIELESCAQMREYGVCGVNGDLWAPGEKWCQDQSNLFKIIANPSNKENNS